MERGGAPTENTLSLNPLEFSHFLSSLPLKNPIAPGLKLQAKSSINTRNILCFLVLIQKNSLVPLK